MANENAHWFDKKEASKSTRPYRLTFWCLSHLPRFLTNFITWCASLFYFFAHKTSREEAIRYQKILKEFNPEFKIRPLKQVTSFAVSLVEKIDCWTNPKPPISFKQVQFRDDDEGRELLQRFKDKKGSFIFISHLGNFEVLRSLVNADDTGAEHEVPFSVLSNFDVSSNFSKVLQELAPHFFARTIPDNSITPATMERLMDTIERGGVVVCSGDRLSKNSSSRTITEKFLGRDAPFSYGAFLLATLLKAPVYFVFAFKKHNIVFARQFEMRVVRARTSTAVSRKERDTCIQNLCREYAATLEKFCKIYPYQWHNFFDFWAFPQNRQNDPSQQNQQTQQTNEETAGEKPK